VRTPSLASSLADALSPCRCAANGEAFAFQIDDFRKHCLLNGLDDIGLTLAKADLINAFETRYLGAQPWINGIGLRQAAHA
jgi:3-isopropylmalate/(R)-2-methylmalate dehydratase small subunit